jgi:hypothetical protein
MKTGGGYLARLAARAATPAVAPQAVLFHAESAPPGLNPLAMAPVPQEIVLAPPPSADAASAPAPAPVTGASSRSRPLAGPAVSVPAQPDVAGHEPGSPLPLAQMDQWRSAATERRVTRPAASWDESALRGLDSSGRPFSRPIPQAAAASVASPLREATKLARVAQAAAPPPQPAILTQPAIEPDTLRSAHEPATIPPTAKPAPTRQPEQQSQKSEVPKDAPQRREPVGAKLSPSLAALEQITGLWQARAARQPSRESAAARAAAVTIGTLEVRVAAPPAPVPMPRRAPASPPAPLARGFRAFGLRQS